MVLRPKGTSHNKENLPSDPSGANPEGPGSQTPPHPTPIFACRRKTHCSFSPVELSSHISAPLPIRPWIHLCISLNSFTKTKSNSYRNVPLHRKQFPATEHGKKGTHVFSQGVEHQSFELVEAVVDSLASSLLHQRLVALQTENGIVYQFTQNIM